MNLPAKRLVPAHVIPATSAVDDVKTTSADKTTPSPSVSVDTVTSAAVAAVVATQTYMKVLVSVFQFDLFWITVATAVYLVRHCT